MNVDRIESGIVSRVCPVARRHPYCPRGLFCGRLLLWAEVVCCHDGVSVAIGGSVAKRMICLIIIICQTWFNFDFFFFFFFFALLRVGRAALMVRTRPLALVA